MMQDYVQKPVPFPITGVLKSVIGTYSCEVIGPEWTNYFQRRFSIILTTCRHYFSADTLLYAMEMMLS
jgi:hypothetical protein